MSYRKVYWEFGTKAKASAVEVHTPTLNAGNIAVQLGLADDFEAACDAVSLGNSGTRQVVAVVDNAARNPSTNPAAQRENKWLVSMVDSVTGLPFSFTIPCYDSSMLSADGESMDTTIAEYANLVVATEAYVRSPVGNAGSVTSVTFRSRTL